MRRSWILALVVALSATATALGQRGTATYVTAVGPDSQGARLEVRARPGGVCARVRWDRAESGSEGCSNLPRIDLRTPFALNVSATTASREQAVGGAVRSGIARVEYVLADGRRFGADTVAAPGLGGRLARALRYFLLELPAGAEPVTRRLLDASGRVVDEQDGLFELGSGDGPPPLKGPARIAAGRLHGVRWALYAALRNELEPVRGDAGRRVPTVCTLPSPVSEDTSACADAARPSFTLGTEPGCVGRRVALLYGIADAGARVQVRLGDRRLHPARMAALPAGYAQAGARAWVFPVPFDAAVQSVRALAADGRLLQELTLRQEPPQLTCALGAFGVELISITGGDRAPVFTGPPVLLQPGGGPPLTVRDAGAELCVAVGAASAERTCIAPAPWAIASVIALSGGDRVVGGAVDPAVAAVEVTAGDGSTRRVPTDPGSAYAGRYAGLMRFFSVAAPRRERLVSLDLLDARGRRLFTWPIKSDIEARGPQRRILTDRAPGGRFDLVRARFAVPLLRKPVECLSLVRRGDRARDPFEDCLASPGGNGRLSTRDASGSVRCDLRAAVIVGGASRLATAVRLRLSDGSTRSGRLFDSPLGRAFLAVPPSRLGLRGIEIADRTGRVLQSFRTRVPPAARQCGYGFALPSEDPRTVRAATPSRVSQPYAAHRSNRLTAWPWQRR